MSISREKLIIEILLDFKIADKNFSYGHAIMPLTELNIMGIISLNWEVKKMDVYMYVVVCNAN